MEQPIISLCMFCSLWYRLFGNPYFSCNGSYRCLYRWSIVLLWAHISAWCHGYPIYKTNNCWYLVDAHIHHGVTYISHTVSAEQAAITSYMHYCHKATFILAEMQDQNGWCSIDAYFQNGAGTVLRLFLPLQAASTSFTDVCNQSPRRLSGMQS